MPKGGKLKEEVSKGNEKKSVKLIKIAREAGGNIKNTEGLNTERKWLTELAGKQRTIATELLSHFKAVFLTFPNRQCFRQTVVLQEN